MSRLTFSRSERLRKVADFDRVYSKGKRVAAPSLVLIFYPSQLETTRLGLSVGSKIGNAVVRNRLKRRLREVFRLNKHRLRRGYDLLLVARKGLEELKFREIHALVLSFFRKADLFAQDSENLSGGKQPACGC